MRSSNRSRFSTGAFAVFVLLLPAVSCGDKAKNALSPYGVDATAGEAEPSATGKRGVGDPAAGGPGIGGPGGAAGSVGRGGSGAGGAGGSGSGGMTASGGSTGTGGRETVLDAGVHDASRGLDAIAARLDMSAPPPTDARPACGAAGFCNDIEAEYEAAYKQALACKPLARISCDQKAYSHLTCQSCQTWVNSSVEVDKIRVRWETLACDKCVRPCPLIAIRCINLTNGSCADPDKDGVGQCAEKGPVVGPPVITN